MANVQALLSVKNITYLAGISGLVFGLPAAVVPAVFLNTTGVFTKRANETSENRDRNLLLTRAAGIAGLANASKYLFLVPRRILAKFAAVESTLLTLFYGEALVNYEDYGANQNATKALMTTFFVKTVLDWYGAYKGEEELL